MDDKLAAIFFLFISISISFFMYSGEVTRNFFYIITYIAIIYFIFITLKKKRKSIFTFSHGLFLHWASVNYFG